MSRYPPGPKEPTPHDTPARLRRRGSRDTLESVLGELFIASDPVFGDEETTGARDSSSAEYRTLGRPISSVPGEEISGELDAWASDSGVHTREWRFDGMSHVGDIPSDANVIGARYRVLEGVALGGMGAVYKVAHLQLGKAFALKIVHPDMADTRLTQFFLREARVLSRLNHPNIVQITDFGTDERFGAFLVMEYLRGQVLLDRLTRKGPLGVAQSLRVALQVAEALHYMHQRELIHCDIKPDNVFLCDPPEGQQRRATVKLIDFGLSRSTVVDGQLSQGEVGGTPLYAAPEQIAGEAPHPSMDIYAMGALLYVMLTGRAPFDGSPEEIAAAKVMGPPRPPSRRLVRELDPRVDALTLKAMATEPRERQATMADLIYELRTVTDMLGHRREGRTAPKPAPATPETSREPDLQHWERCPMPVFQTDRRGRIRHATEAFGVLVREPVLRLLGRTPGSTLLGNVYPDVDADVAQVVLHGVPIQRRLDFQQRDGGQATVIVWLVPETGGGRVSRVWANVLPLEEDL